MIQTQLYSPKIHMKCNTFTDNLNNSITTPFYIDCFLHKKNIHKLDFALQSIFKGLVLFKFFIHFFKFSFATHTLLKQHLAGLAISSLNLCAQHDIMAQTYYVTICCFIFICLEQNFSPETCSFILFCSRTI